MRKLILIILAHTMLATMAFSQENNQLDSASTNFKNNKAVTYRHSIGASLLMILNFFPDPADYYLLTYGYQLTQKDRIFVEFNTWKYSEPIGTYGNSDELYPGYTRTYGMGVGYQRFHWKGLFNSVEATPFMKRYFDEDKNHIQNGFQLYLQLVTGYRLEFFKKRFYVEPAYALKYWPIDTNFPTEFAAVEKGAPNYIFEFSLNVGWKF